MNGREKNAARVASYEAIILKVLTEAAERGDVCPMNETLAKLIGGGKPARASWYIARLQAAGLIEVERWPNARMITIVATGKSTASAGLRAQWAGSGKKEVPVSVVSTAARQVEPPVPDVLPMQRVSCAWCGATSMVGCRHLRRAGLVEPQGIAA